ncbi:hypothetical protein C8R46DRAFT_1094505 [Mycena filopes]|nr:hypothetical protein C8R46DRAFT_1094505 [Mycena filopes]
MTPTTPAPLRVENLSRLPLSIKRMAISAARGSSSDFYSLITHIARRPTKKDLCVECLPVFYIYLDPAAIPNGDVRFTGEIDRALISIIALRSLGRFHAPLGLHLWPRMWPWLTFLNLYRHILPDPRNIPLDLLFFVQLFINDEETARLVGSTVGVRSIVVDAWKSLCGPEEDAAKPDEWLQLASVLDAFMGASEAANRVEILEATDGPPGLAALIIHYIKIPAPSRAPPIFYGSINHLLSDFLQDANSPLGPALISAGFVKPFTTALFALSDFPDTHEDRRDLRVLFPFFDILQKLFNRPASHKAIADAIHAGLLFALVRTAPSVTLAMAEDSSLWSMVTATLPGATVYRDVVQRLEAQLPAVKELSSKRQPLFPQPTVYEDWQRFVGIAHERIELLRTLDSGDHVSLRACDNMTCGKIQEKQQFRRCSGCSELYYCSSECQRVDWRDSGHRVACQSFRRWRLQHADLGSRDLRFMRALMHKHSRTFDGVDMLSARLRHMREHPHEPLLYCIDLCTGGATASVGPVDSAERRRDEKEKGDVLWDEHVARAAQSCGRMELHLLLVRDGIGIRRLMFPRRAATATVWDALVSMRNAEGDWDADADAALVELAERAEREVYIHQ